MSGLPSPLVMAVLLAAGSLPLHAQLGGFYALGEGIPFAKPVYHVENTTVGRQNFEDQLNDAGAVRRLRLVPLFFSAGSPQQANIYFSGTSGETTTYTADVLPATGTLTDFLAQLNERGGQGYRFSGGEVTTPGIFTDPFNPIPAEQSHVFVKTSNPSTYIYETTAQAPGAAAFLTLVNTRGAAGWQWVSTLSVNGGAAGVPVFQELFVRTTGSSATFSYRIPAAESTGDAGLAQKNAQGLEGYRWLGPFDFGTFPASESREIYQKDSRDDRTYFYTAPPATSSAADFLTQANAQGSQGLTFLAPVVYPGDASGIRNLYTGYSSPATPAVVLGSIAINQTGEVSFLIEGIFARYQLYTSPDLRSWSTFGEPRSGLVGETIRWTTGTPVGRRFYRVQGIPRVMSPG